MGLHLEIRWEIHSEIRWWGSWDSTETLMVHVMAIVMVDLTGTTGAESNFRITMILKNTEESDITTHVP